MSHTKLIRLKYRNSLKKLNKKKVLVGIPKTNKFRVKMLPLSKTLLLS